MWLSSFISYGDRHGLLSHPFELLWHCVVQTLVDAQFARITYTKAVDLLAKSQKEFEFPVRWGDDLQTEHERYLTEVAFDGVPVFVTDYPKGIKAFYMKLNEDHRTVAATDMLVPG